MIKRLLAFLTLLGLPLLILLSTGNSSAALLTLLSTDQNISATTQVYDAEAVKPAECNSINLEDNNIVTGNGAFSDIAGKNSLLIGTDAVNAINGLDGSDCIVANDGDDTIDGGDGADDVCLGGNGDDQFYNCEACYGGSGTDTDMTGTCAISDSVELP
jgi:Ca2+-binding RTX toxin-like protein